jgi:hypothetical protein
VRRFSIVPICSKRLFIIFYRWFVDEVGLCVDLALYLLQHKNFSWLFEHKLLLVECIGYVWFVRKECIVPKGEVGMFSFVGPFRPYIPCNSQDDFHHRGHIAHHSVFLFCGTGLSNGHLCIWPFFFQFVGVKFRAFPAKPFIIVLQDLDALVWTLTWLCVRASTSYCCFAICSSSCMSGDIFVTPVI